MSHKNIFRRFVRLLLFALTLCLLGSPALAADLTIVYKTKMDGRSGEKTVYWSDKFQRSSDKAMKQDTLVDYEKGVTYTIDHARKEIQVMDLKAMAGMMGQMGPMMNQAMGMKGVGDKLQKGMEQKLGKAEAAPLEKLGPRQIAGRSCENYRITRKGKSTFIEEVCLDATLKAPGELNPALTQLAEASQEMMEGPLSGFMAAGSKELRGLPGVALRSYNKMDKAESLEEATQIKEGPIEASVFQLPSNYKMVDQMKEMQEQMGEIQKQLGNFKK